VKLLLSFTGGERKRRHEAFELSLFGKAPLKEAKGRIFKEKARKQGILAFLSCPELLLKGES